MTLPIPEEALKAWNNGRKVEAIKLLREQSKLGLAEAKNLLESMHEGIPPMRDAATIPPGLEQRIAAELAQGHKIEAIKLLREACGLSLAEAKSRVDAAEKGLVLDLRSEAPPPRSASGSAAPGEVPRGSGLGWVVLAIAAAVAYGVWHYFGRP